MKDNSYKPQNSYGRTPTWQWQWQGISGLRPGEYRPDNNYVQFSPRTEKASCDERAPLKS